MTKVVINMVSSQFPTPPREAPSEKAAKLAAPCLVLWMPASPIHPYLTNPS